jgi:putative zinc finger protein
MRCKEASQQLQLYLDNRLTIQQVRKLEAHLTSCNACLEELALFETVVNDLETLKVVVEPDDLSVKIMRRVAMAASQHDTTPSRFSLWRPSPLEILVAATLATIATIGTILQQPSIRSLLPFANGHNGFSLEFLNILRLLMTVDSTTLILALWIAGTFLGVCITLIFAGSEMRTQWFKAMMERLPVR